MTKNLLKTPVHWLELDVCETIFDRFKTQIEFQEPLPPFSSRFNQKLEGILGSVKQTFDGQLLNPTVLDAGTAYLTQIIRDHPFKNGNKRMGLVFSHVFLLAHQVEFTLNFNELYQFAIFLATVKETKTITHEEIKDQVKKVVRDFTKDVGGRRLF